MSEKQRQIVINVLNQHIEQIRKRIGQLEDDRLNPNITQYLPEFNWKTKIDNCYAEIQELKDCIKILK